VACLCVIPYGLPGLSYNTLTMGWFALGLFVLARALLAPAKLPSARRSDAAHARVFAFLRSPFVGAGLAHGAASFAYPTMALGAGASAIAIAILAKGQRVRDTLRYVTGGVAFGLVVSPSLLRAGTSRLREVLVYTARDEQSLSGLGSRLHAVFVSFIELHPQLLVGGLLVALLMLLARRWPMPVLLVLPFVPLLARGSAVDAPVVASIAYVACFAMFAPIVCLALRDTAVARVLLVGIAMPTLVAGIATAWSSSNAAKAAGVGLYPGVILGVIALAIFIEEGKSSLRWGWLRDVLELSPAVLVAVLIAYVVARDSCYRDKPLPELTSVIAEGPYAGLYTTPRTKADLGRISADVHAHAHGSRALFFYDFPAGYLIAYQRPLVTSPWTFVMPSRVERDARFFRERAEPGELVMRDDGRWAATSPPPAPETLPDGASLGTTPLDIAVSERCDLLTKGPGYSMYVVR
jgi:hypothetical protein